MPVAYGPKAQGRRKLLPERKNSATKLWGNVIAKRLIVITAAVSPGRKNRLCCGLGKRGGWLLVNEQKKGKKWVRNGHGLAPVIRRDPCREKTPAEGNFAN